ncbi:polysaccharide pyruvyl transferase family protein [Pseudoalteromonas sp. S2893]|uniref:polysaccharide pyruvyl transferase family protein n=1 Tax=Pseudoalteromonas sp. S2893 TaxID=579530 RepID=UPI00110A53FC|nr:polysaccharide pyruvyl transferase family protein [Pseudoalteromonas sp. S2893]TMP13892.1 polysaccharide pyruvyl transferase family protein [Pseudoalteromonas sp. S2893]
MSNKKIGIITFHNAHNYGAVLQAYGLYRKLQLLGFESEFIQDANDTVGKKYSLYPSYKNKPLLSFCKSWLLLLADYKRKSKRSSAFNDFIENYLPTYDLNRGCKSYSHVVLGSDQIWNFNITSGIQNIYFGENENIRTESVFSYAASMGNGMEASNFTPSFKSKLEGLSAIGVREKSLSDEIKDNFDLESVVTLDPTLLLENEEWNKLLSSKESTDNPYLLVYEVEKNSNTAAVVEYVKNKLGLEVKVISSKIKAGESKSNITTASPREFLSLFKNASFVVTTSFHGTVFSLINEVPFFTIKFNSKVDLRSSGLLGSVELCDRHIESIADVDELTIDFTNAKENLSALRIKSETYLLNSLNEIS